MALAKTKIILLSFFLAVNGYAFLYPKDEKLILKTFQTSFAGRKDGIQTTLERSGNKTIELESFVSLDGDFEKASRILTDYPRYADWALKGINESPRGGSYFMKILGLLWKEVDQNQVTVHYLFDFPVIHKEGHRKFEVEVDTKAKDRFSVKAKNVEQSDLFIESCEAVVLVFRVPLQKDRLWCYVYGRAKLRSWLLYEVLLEKVIRRELGERIHTVLLNYQKKELASNLD